MAAYDSKKIENEILKMWEKGKIAEKITSIDSEKKKFYLLDGPPYTTGNPHVGHAKTTIAKDIWGKIRTMQGYSVRFQPGFDCNGLPIENKVEAELGVASKRDIEEKVGVDSFIGKCKEYAEGNIPTWMTLYRQLGAWVGWVEPYKTYKNSYLESGWWTIKRVYDKGLVVQGLKPLHWCPRCETTISAFEAQDAYKDVTDTAIYVKFPLKGRKNEYMAVFTTTPWTLPGNVAIAVHPDENYVKVDVSGEKIIIAEPLLKEVLGKAKIKDYKVVEKFKGKELENVKYEAVLDVESQRGLNKEENARRIILSVPILLKKVSGKVASKEKLTDTESSFGHLVTMDVGTGAVHIAPGHGQEDNKLGAHYNLPILSPVKEDGTLDETTGEFSGKFVKDADKDIIEYLSDRGLLLHAEQITHSYPLCWRCKTPLIFRMSSQWFFKIDAIKERMLSGNKKIKWLPEFAKMRMHNWLEGAEDWAFSTQRYWGIPLPIWTCEKCDSIKVIGSRKELIDNSTEKLPNDVDLHKNTVDKIKIKCSCGGEMKRIADTANVWLDSGIAPWASMGYPFENKELFERMWPVDQISESEDQIRAWFYHMLFMGAITFDEMPFKAASMTGWTLDYKGHKMSKSVGNVISAKEAADELGSDILRLYYCSDIALWETQKFSIDGAKELSKTLNALWNTNEFLKTYSKSDYSRKLENLSLEDKWIISRVNTLTKDVSLHFEEFEWHFAGRKIIDFILNDLSRWYVKLIRERTAPLYSGKDKQAAFAVTAYVLDRLVRLCAPITPFIAEAIYQDLREKKDPESVHLCRLPEAEESMIDSALEVRMEVAKDVVEAANAARQENNIKIRWPVAKITVAGDKKTIDAAKKCSDIIERIGNIKSVGSGDIKMSVSAKPNFKLIGPHFGKDAGAVASIITKEDAEELKKLAEKGKFKLGKYEIEPEMILFTESLAEGMLGKEFSSGAVYLDTSRTDEILEESLIRELTRKVQTMRKEKMLNVHDVIDVHMDGESELLSKWKEDIESGCTCKLHLGEVSGKMRSELEFEGKKIKIGF